MTSKPIIKWMKIMLPFGLGLFFLWYFLKSTTAAQREDIWDNIKDANLYWVLLSVVLGFLSHIIRANRWRLLLKPLNDTPKLSTCFFSVMFGYLANLGIPRSGEVLRGATYASYTKLTFEQSFGTIITERVIDFIMLLLIIGLALVLQSEQLLSYLDVDNLGSIYAILLLIPIIIAGYFFIRLLKFSNNKFILRLRIFLLGLYDGIKSIFSLKEKWSFVMQTISIWGLYFLMFWIIKFSIPGTENMSLGGTLVAFIAGAFSMSITSGGVIVYPIAIATVYKLYNVPVEIGQAFGWIIWTSHTLIVIFTGTISAVLLPVFNKKL